MSSDISFCVPILLLFLFQYCKRKKCRDHKKGSSKLFKIRFRWQMISPWKCVVEILAQILDNPREGFCWTAIAFLPLTLGILTTTDNWNNKTDFSVTTPAFQLAQPSSWKVIHCKLVEVLPPTPQPPHTRVSLKGLPGNLNLEEKIFLRPSFSCHPYHPTKRCGLWTCFIISVESCGERKFSFPCRTFSFSAFFLPHSNPWWQKFNWDHCRNHVEGLNESADFVYSRV